MSHYTQTIIRIIGSIFVIYGVIKIFSGFKSTWWSLQFLFAPPISTPVFETIYYSGITLLTIVLPVGSILAGIGLLKQEKWGWICSIVVSLIIFLISFVGTVNSLVASYRFRNAPIPEAKVVMVHSVIPTYIQCAVSLIFLLLLFRRFVKQSFY